VSDKGPSFFECQAGLLSVRLKIENRQIFRPRLHGPQEEVHLFHAVRAHPKVIGTPEEPGGLGLGPIHCLHWIYVTRALCSLMNHSHNSGCLCLGQIDVAVVVRQVNNHVQRIYHDVLSHSSILKLDRAR